MKKNLMNLGSITILVQQEIMYIRDFGDLMYEAPFRTSLFEAIRRFLGMAALEKINDIFY